MIVYVESNFILEIARQQEQATSAEALLAAAEAGRIGMRWPAFCLPESLGNLVRRGNDRQYVQALLLQHADDLGRSGPHAALTGRLRDVSRDLVAVEALELSRLDQVAQKLLNLGTPLPLDVGTYQDAIRHRAGHDLSVPDAVVYASVLADLRQSPRGPKLFVSRDARAFRRVAAELAVLGCTYMESFDQALQTATAS